MTWEFPCIYLRPRTPRHRSLLVQHQFQSSRRYPRLCCIWRHHSAWHQNYCIHQSHLWGKLRSSTSHYYQEVLWTLQSNHHIYNKYAFQYYTYHPLVDQPGWGGVLYVIAIGWHPLPPLRTAAPCLGWHPLGRTAPRLRIEPPGMAPPMDRMTDIYVCENTTLPHLLLRALISNGEDWS